MLKAPEAGTLTVVTRQVGTGDAPDLVLEVFTDADFADAKDRSDQDLQGNSANESATVQVDGRPGGARKGVEQLQPRGEVPAVVEPRAIGRALEAARG